MQGAVGEFKTGRIIVGNDVQDPLNMQSWYVMVLISYSQRFALEAASTESVVSVCLGLSFSVGQDTRDEHTLDVNNAASLGLHNRDRDCLAPKPYRQSYTRCHFFNFRTHQKHSILDQIPAKLKLKLFI